MPSITANHTEAAFAVMLAVALTVYLGAPPAWHADFAQAECEQFVVDRLDGEPGDATARWEMLPSAHWAGSSGSDRVASLGWIVAAKMRSSIAISVFPRSEADQNVASPAVAGLFQWGWLKGSTSLVCPAMRMMSSGSIMVSSDVYRHRPSITTTIRTPRPRTPETSSSPALRISDAVVRRDRNDMRRNDE
jgi:hypothetical protein